MITSRDPFHVYAYFVDRLVDIWKTVDEKYDALTPEAVAPQLMADAKLLADAFLVAAPPREKKEKPPAIGDE